MLTIIWFQVLQDAVLKNNYNTLNEQVIKKTLKDYFPQ